MRRLWLAAAMLGTVSAAHAADMPDLPVLRGGFTDGLSKTPHNWDGAYVGVQAGYAADATDFSQSVVGLTNFIFRDSVLQQPTSSVVAPEQDQHAEHEFRRLRRPQLRSGTMSSSASRAPTATSTTSPRRRRAPTRSDRQSRR